MNTTATHTALRFAQPLETRRELAPRPDITRPFQAAWRRAPQHDMLLLTAHPDLLPAPEPAPARDLTRFDLGRP